MPIDPRTMHMIFMILEPNGKDITRPKWAYDIVKTVDGLTITGCEQTTVCHYIERAESFINYYRNTRWARFKRWWREL